MMNLEDSEHDNQIAYLLRLAGRRPSPGADRIERAREAARAEWTRVVHSRGRRRWLAAAAVLGIGVVGGAIWLSQSEAPVVVVEPADLATVQRVIGDVRVRDRAGRQVGVGTIQRLRAGDRVEVAEAGRAAFELVEGTSVRLAGATAVLFDTGNRLELARGIVYVDSNPSRPTSSVSVDTPFGKVSHVGTQFELRLQPHSLSVRVREGDVVVETRQERVSSKIGEALLITRDRPVERSTIPTSGAEWDWVADLARPFTLEGATVSAFLQWVSREQGWRWEYADAATRRQADSAVLHGSIDGLTPEQALAAVLPASGLTSTRTGNLLIVGLGTR